MSHIDGNTKAIGVIGNPIGHTLSPLIHNTMAAFMGLNFSYSPYEVADVEGAVRGIRALGFAGMNVTIPHKGAVMEYLDEIDDYAQRAGAVNTIVNRGGRLYGYNTDGEGLLCSLKREGIDPRGATVAILGAGGAARGAAVALEEAGAEKLLIINRSASAAKRLCALLKNAHVAGIDSLKEADILINATPVGMHPNAGVSPLSDLGLLRPEASVMDMIYNPRETLLLKGAREEGRKAVNGLGMLIYQAAASFSLFTGQTPPERLLELIIRRLSLEKGIVLTGFMGTGKTTIGKALSRLLATEFIDCDECIEREMGKSISDFFTELGEGRFREIESEMIKKLSCRHGAVIALGGGAVLNPENINAFKGRAVVIRLTSSIEDIMEKLGGFEGRPLIKGKTKEQIIDLLRQREPYYKNCDCEVDVSGMSVRTAAARVLKAYWKEINAL